MPRLKWASPFDICVCIGPAGTTIYTKICWRDITTTTQVNTCTRVHLGVQRWIAVNGTVTPQYGNITWHFLNDGDESTSCYAMNDPNAYMELDFGVGGQEMNRVRVVHSKDVLSRANGVTLYAMDDARRVLLEYTFKDVTETSAEFAIPPPPAVGPGQMVRYLRLQRSIGSDYMNITILEAYLRSRRWRAIDGIVTPQYGDLSWMHLNDGDIYTIAQTQNAAFAYMELDLGLGGRKTSRIRVVHRPGEMERSNGVTLYAMNENRQVIMQQTFAGLTNDSPADVSFSIPTGVPPPPPNGVMVRYLRLKRTKGSDYINEARLEAWQGSCTFTYLEPESM